MGIIHKLRPEVRDFIVIQKKNTPTLSCRNLTSLIVAQFQINVSKSSINVIFKENNLSMPIGRRPKLNKKKFNMPALPIIEEVTAITLVDQPVKTVQEQEVSPSLREAEDAAAVKKVEQEKLDKEAQEQARQAEKEAELKLEEEKQVKLAEEAKKIAEQKAIEEVAKKVEQERLAKEAAKQAQQNRLAKEAEELARQAEDGRKRLEEEAELKAEREKWAKLAEEEFKSKQLVVQEEVKKQKDETSAIGRLPMKRACSGAIFLKVIDYLIGGSKQINEIICKKMGNHPEDFIALTEAVIFRSLFGRDNLAALCSLVGQNISVEKLDNYYTEIQQIKTIRMDIARIISNAFTEARGVKVHFVDGSIVYFDAQLHTTWSTPYLPYDFASAAYDLRNNLNKHFFEAQPLVLLVAPGYDVPAKEFFNLLSNIGSSNKGPDNLILYGNKLEEFENISLNQENNYSFVFGLWPWQFTTARKIKKIGNFNLEHIESINMDLYLAEIEVDLLQPSTNQSVTLQGCAVKTDLKEKIRVVILSSDRSLVNLNKMAQIYLSRWPNLEEGFADFSRKVEVFTYTGSTQNFFSTESFGLSKTETNLELEETFVNYIKILDAYLRWHFLPEGYTEKDFSYTTECFYNAQVKLDVGQLRVTAQIQMNQESSSLKDLKYLMRRLNERQINFDNDKTFYFENAFK